MTRCRRMVFVDMAGGFVGMKDAEGWRVFKYPTNDPGRGGRPSRVFQRGKISPAPVRPAHGFSSGLAPPGGNSPAMPHVPGLRSCYAKVGRLVYFGRMLDKLRLHAAGQLPAEYVNNLGDGQLF